MALQVAFGAIIGTLGKAAPPTVTLPEIVSASTTGAQGSTAAANTRINHLRIVFPESARTRNSSG